MSHLPNVRWNVRSGPGNGAQSSVVRHVVTRRISRSVDFYLALGLEVASTTDGWVLLRADTGRIDTGRIDTGWIDTENIELEHRPESLRRAALVLYVYAADPEALRRRLVAAGAPVGARTYSVDVPHGVFTAIDPDGNVIVVNARDSADRVRALPAPDSRTHAGPVMSVPS